MAKNKKPEQDEEILFLEHEYKKEELKRARVKGLKIAELLSFASAAVSTSIAVIIKLIETGNVDIITRNDPIMQKVVEIIKQGLADGSISSKVIKNFTGASVGVGVVSLISAVIWAIKKEKMMDKYGMYDEND